MPIAVHRPSRFTQLLPVCAAAASGLFTGSARVSADEASPERLFRLDRLDAYIEVRGDYRYGRVRTDARRPSGRDRSQTNREWGFEERFGLTFGGTVIDPRFITFGGDLSFGLSQDHFEEFGSEVPTRRDTDRGTLLRYDLRVNFFPGRRFSGSVYGVRRDDRISRRFQPILDERRTGFGTSWTLVDENWPMEFRFDYLDTDRSGNRDGRDNEQYTESSFYYELRRVIDEHHSIRFSYEHSQTEQDFQGGASTFETTRDLFKIDHELEFGDDGQHVYRTLIHWQEERGDFARDLFEIGPQLTLRHSDQLQTSYEYQFNREQYEGLDIETHRADFQLVHQVYTNLTTTVNLFALYEDIEDDINTTQAGASVDWQYNRRNRFGHLYANLALAFDTEDVDGDDGERIVLNESHTFRDPVALRLANRDVVAASIVITNTGNRRIFLRGVDYSVYRQGDVTRITRLRTGRISDGATVLVDYAYRTPTNGRLDTMRVDFSIEQRFKSGLTPYYRLSYRNQEDDSSTGFRRRADRTDHHRIGVTYERPAYTVGGEFEIFDDTIDPYDAFHLNGLLHIIGETDHSLDASARFSRLFFEGGFDDRNVTMIDVQLDYHRRFSEALSTIGRLGYRFEGDSSAGDTHAWDAVVGFEYVMGELSSELTFEYDRLDLSGSQDEELGVYFRVRRNLTNVFSR